jgi:predicted RNA-binding protein YlxR (DUF448 family)
MSRPAGLRTCVACRSEEDREDLVRVVCAPDGALVVDLKGSLPGRGAWLHPAAGCVERAEREPGHLARAFHGAVPTAGLAAAVRDAVERALTDGLSLAAAGGGLVFGHDAVDDATTRGVLVHLLTASDASPRTVASVKVDAIPTTTLPLDRDGFGRRVGQGPLAVAGVRDLPCTVHLRRQLRRWTRLG